MIDSATLAGLAAAGVFAGAIGALIGIGGGILIVPALMILFHVAPHAAVAASLVGVVATSTAAGSVYVGAGLTNMRLGMSLEIATTIGGVVGGLVAALISPWVLSAFFGFLLVVTATLLAIGQEPDERPAAHDAGAHGRSAPGAEPSGYEERGRLAGAYYDQREGKLVRYRAHRWPLGAAVSLLAGGVSGLLGVGGGFLKVPAMSLGMGVPIRVAAATSNFMIGVTAIASLFVYFARGDLEPYLTAPLTVGVVAGSLAATRFAGRIPTRTLRLVTAIALFGVAIEMIVRAVHDHGHAAA